VSNGLDALYPFLYPGRGDLDAVVAEVRRSIQAKAREIADLRDRLADELGERLVACARTMARAFRRGGTLYTFGNGGSATDAQSVAQLFLHPPAGLSVPAMALSNDVAAVTALANDVGFDVVFARQLAAFGHRHDIALGLSTSGNSSNVLRALDEARGRGLLTIGFGGYDGGKLAELESLDYLFVVPSSSVHRIQEAQTTLYHVLWELTQEALREVARHGDGDEEARDAHPCPVDQRRPEL
jgi:D-sedoheptulose 7-phosphate isomerase